MAGSSSLMGSEAIDPKVEQAQMKMKQYLDQVYAKLIQMKKEYLKDNTSLTREELKKQLTNMGCWLERTRLYLDNYIYPRDHSLNLIDI